MSNDNTSISHRFSESSCYVKWKLRFHFDNAKPEQIFTCWVKSAYIFKGRFLMVTRPECFHVRSLCVGLENQIMSAEVPCSVLCGRDILLPIAVIGIAHKLEIRNSSSFTLPFYAELHGTILLKEGEEPRKNDWEDVSIL
jgi:hypothetical protein